MRKIKQNLRQLKRKGFWKQNWDILLTYIPALLFIIFSIWFITIATNNHWSGEAALGLIVVGLLVIPIIYLFATITVIRTFSKNLNKKRLWWLLPHGLSLLSFFGTIIMSFEYLFKFIGLMI